MRDHVTMLAANVLRGWGHRRWAVLLGALVGGLLVVGAFASRDDGQAALEPASADITAPGAGASPEPATGPAGTTEATRATPATAASTVTDGEVALAITYLDAAPVVDQLVAHIAYERDGYTGGGWPDSDGDCQSDRHEILIEESLTDVVLSADGCSVETGTWVDRYDGATYTSADDVTIDHLVALSAAHRAGAWAWDDASKQRFATDIGFPAAHAAVAADINQAKADKEPDRWRPPLESAWCRYAIDWISVKTRWSLNYSTAEATSLREMLGTCQPVAAEDEATPVPLAAPEHAIAAPPVTSAPVDTQPGPARVVIESCNARAEVVVLVNRGGEPITLTGWVLHDRGRNHELGLGVITLESGARISILTGDNVVDANAAGTIVWKRLNVWNNDGDTAYLLDSTGNQADSRGC